MTDRIQVANCIYCDGEANSKEDWLPRGFGAFQGITLLKERICVECNNVMGREVDQDLLRTGPAGLRRSLLEIEGRNGPTPDVFLYKVMGPASATTMRRPSQDGNYEILGSSHMTPDGVSHAPPLRQLVFRRPDGTMVPIPFPPNYDGTATDRTQCH